VPFSGICAPHFSQKAINFYRPFAQIPAVDMPPPFRRASIFIVFIITNSISVVNACQEILRKPSAALPMFCLRLRKRVKHTHFSKIKPGF